MMPAPGWYVIGRLPRINRWWDGTRWTDAILVSARRGSARRTTTTAELRSWRRTRLGLWALLGVGTVAFGALVSAWTTQGWSLFALPPAAQFLGVVLVMLVGLTTFSLTRGRRIRRSLADDAPPPDARDASGGERASVA